MRSIIKLGLAIIAAATLTLSAAAHDTAYRPDPWITTKTKIALFTADDVSASRIHVDTVNGRITLHGKVATAAEKARAEEIARGIDGARDVRNLLQVVPESGRKTVKIEDESLKKRVEEALDADVALNESDIDVESVDKGVVLLSGSADTLSAHLRAIEIASSVDGVRRVASEIRSPDLVSDQEIWRDQDEDDTSAANPPEKRSLTQRATDMWITSAAKALLIADADTPADEINVDTRNGVVTLFGTVPSREARKAAEADVRKVAGVKRVQNELEVVTPDKQKAVQVRDADAEAAAKDSLDAHDEFEDVSVEVKNGVARLTGTVGSQSDRLMAAVIVRSSTGVRAVENDVTVSYEK
ncbi:MAG TPA: BON domain-containing protein [Candidatus Polarisedimenticolaceae bacterium]|nr:BON domain-containing protein [Candidatus Polarisedimenticolaceae bacterium]